MNQFKSLFGIQDDPNAPLTPEELAQLSNQPKSTAPTTPLPPKPAPVKSSLQDPGLREAEAALAGLPESKPESQLERLERLSQELQTNRSKELEDANRRQMYQDILSGVNSNLGLIVGGAQAMNTKAAVTPAKTGEIRQRDFAKEVSERYKGDQEAMMQKYKALLQAQQEADALTQRQEDRKDDREFRKEMLNASRGDKNKMFDQAEYRRVTDRIQSVAQNYENDSVVKKFKEQDLALNQVNDIITEMQAGNQVAAASLGAKMAKAMGEVGALTEQDVNRYIQSGAITSKVKDKFMNYIAGRPSDMTVQDIKVMAQMMNDGAKRKIYPLQDKYFSRASNYAKQAGITPEEVSDMMGFTNVKSISRQENPKQLPSKVGSKYDEAREWLEKNPNHPKAAEVRAKIGL